MEKVIQEALKHIEVNKPQSVHLQRVSGGDINQAFEVGTKEGHYFVKLNKDIPSDFFRIEAQGLERLRETSTVHVPDVYFFNQPQAGETGIFIQEWIEGTETRNTAYQLGLELGKLHEIEQGQHGYPEPTFIGTLPQPNGMYDSWLEYYRTKRLIPQYERAEKEGRLSGERGRKLDKLIAELDRWIDPRTPSSLLHGDLWGGNWLTGSNGIPYLIDPSVFYGDRLMELAFTELFGGFPADFYNGYQEISPLPSHYPEVKPLYQLYYLLVHLNLFGEAYGKQVDRVLKKYV